MHDSVILAQKFRWVDIRFFEIVLENMLLKDVYLKKSVFCQII